MRRKIAICGQDSHAGGSKLVAARAGALETAASAAHQQPAKERQSRQKSEQRTVLVERQDPSGTSSDW
jgi:hypothetical protein